MNRYLIEIYTDGSCHTDYKVGAWAAIILTGDEKIILKGEAQDTTHNRMELLAAINAIEFASENYKDASLLVYTDSQYVFRIPERKEKLKKNLFVTKKGNQLQNSDLVQKLIAQIEPHKVAFIKVKAHQQQAAKTDTHVNFNSEVDKLVRQMVREAVKYALQPAQAEG